jgi:hypothetical protein
MPFMKGKAPIRRTLKYLEAGSLVLKDRVKVFCVNYNHHGDHHKGARYVFQFNFAYLVLAVSWDVCIYRAQLLTD